ncbi:MAG: D-alanyl-D-alanine carboxypeptidase [Candidatus Eisenbacteria bacterium]|nr:D-alanyl-D-alanine carboxypeptidase [Candidatus Eisenbacteria bacterium]
MRRPGRAPRLARLVPLALVFLGLLLTLHEDALAGRARKQKRRPPRRSAAVQRGPTFDAALVIDSANGTVLFQKDPHAQRTPASLAKMMLELIALESIREGEISIDDIVTVTPEAKKVRGTRVRLRPGEAVTAGDLLKATVIASANDAAIALATHICGSTEACVARMNRRARELGMLSTRYENVHGLDKGGEPGNVTTAWDLAILARRLIDLPEALDLSSTVEATIRSKQRIHTTNRLLTRFPGCDGLKTGYTGRAGHCLVATAERDGIRLISVVLGASGNRRRFAESADLMSKAFAEWQKVRVVAKGQDLGEDLAVRMGSRDSVPLVAGDDLDVLVPAKRAGQIRVAIAAPPSTRAPIAEGWTLGRVQVLVGDSVAAECAALAGTTVPRSSVARRLNEMLQP